MSMISIRHVSKRYDSVTVVDKVSLEIEKGSITAIVGTSGSGKSTLLRMINRLTAMSEGEIWIDGKNIMRQAVNTLRRGIGYVIQGHGLFPHRTVAQNIATVPSLLGWSKAEIDTRVNELLKLFHLEPSHYAHKFPHQLSGGQQQRVGVARALAARPQVLLMDEPFGALDPVIRTKAQEDLLAIQQQFAISILLVTHDMDEAFLLGDRIAVMDKGSLIQYSRPRDILLKPANDFIVQLTGTSERALKLMSLYQVQDYLDSAQTDSPISLSHTTSLREALSTLTWQGETVAKVVNAQGENIGTIHLQQILAAGQAK
ncbi:MAG: amino acid ABC transporter ATP-binding protein [Proteobacteria bacterium]|nr:MAG: amino acid ABC transporter ATP-binding protein [Pseudomonadota bacterium]